MPAGTLKTSDLVVKRLRTLAKESPDLKEAAQVYEAILPILRDADLRVGSIRLTSVQVRESMGKGIPLLAGLDLDLDIDEAHKLMLRLAEAMGHVGRTARTRGMRLPWTLKAPEPGSADLLRRALEENRIDLAPLLQHVAAGDKDKVFAAAMNLALDPELVWALAQNALKPALRAWCRELSPLAKDVPWDRSICFVCGAMATLGELQENDQVKHLRCGTCGSDWLVRRLPCVYCGNEDHRTLQNFSQDGSAERMRVEACDACRRYLKVISAFSPTSAEMLSIEDLATMHLDYIAQVKGYSRLSMQ